MSSRVQLTFENPNDKDTGFLSNRSHYGFVLNDKKWITAEHYIQAMKFAGTSYEDTIREAPTAQKARILARERSLVREADGGIVKEIVYGKNKSTRIREDWKHVEPKIIEEALRAKFKQHPRLVKRLIQTGDFALINTKCKYSGKILERLRREYIKDGGSSTSQPSNTPSFKDISYSQLQPEHIELVDALIVLVKRIMVEEGAQAPHPEMLEDAIYSLIRDEELTITVLDVTTRGTWDYIYSRLPNLRKVTTQVHELLQPHMRVDIAWALLVTAFLRSFSTYEEKLKKKIQSSVKNAVLVELIFLRRQRSYRKAQAPISKASTLYAKRQLKEEDLLEAVSAVKICESMHGFSADQIAIVAALLHLTKGGKGSFYWAFLLLVDPSKRSEVQRYLSKLKIMSGSFEGLRKLCEHLGVTLSEDDMNIIDYAIYYFTRRIGAVTAHTKLFAFAYLATRKLEVSQSSLEDVAPNVSPLELVIETGK